MPDAQDDIYEIAADWADRLNELAPHEGRELAAWLAQDPAHADAFAAMRRLLNDTALIEAGETADIPLPSLRPNPRSGVRRGIMRLPRVVRTNRREALAAGLAGALAIPLSAYWLTRGAPAHDVRYASAIGTRRKVELPDGSTMILDAASRVALDFSSERRTVHLEQGAAHFDVRHDTRRPFTVLTPQARMVALGTRFNVDHLAKASELRVFEGRVGLATRFGANRTVAAHEWVLVGNRALEQEGMFDPSSASDWRDNWLDAHAMRLDQALERLARYTPRSVRLADPGMASLTFSGRFRLDRPEESLGLIASLFALRVDTRGETLVLSRDPRPAQS
ncbi:FecR domain-containing protein [Novosphingobium profundi]|uniref:FecR family protein n=1 Tax=Novosphingobium profundi TaxID=1774954 RepID=UPI001BDB365B|nr:FecR domain-containing protein [Novosphingobium profundi]MBT0667093.1 FecR domain-containing protein [Novosphingobium profundi]